MYISLKPSNTKPNSEDSDIQTNKKYEIAKNLDISTSMIQKYNPSCEDLGRSSVEKCVVYIGIQCEKDCEYTLELQY